MVGFVFVLLVLMLNRPFGYFLFRSKRRLLKKINNFQINQDYNIKMLLHKQKNTFAAIDKMAERARYRLEKEPARAEEFLEMICDISKEAMGEINLLTNTLKTDQEKKSDRVDILECMDRAIGRVPMEEKISFTKEYEVQNKIVYGDEGMLVEVFVNLLRNAVEALKDGENRKEKKISVRIYNENAYLVTEVRDNGCGISKRDRRYIFYPFFSRKSGGSNNGIGLFYVKNIVEMHDGRVFVESREGEYTLFQVVLPNGRRMKRIDYLIGRRRGQVETADLR